MNVLMLQPLSPRRGPIYTCPLGCTKIHQSQNFIHRGKNFDKVVGEWKAKADDLHAELDACHSECRNFSAETFRLKAALDETNEQLDIVRRENKNLADEIKVQPQNGFTLLSF